MWGERVKKAWSAEEGGNDKRDRRDPATILGLVLEKKGADGDQLT